MPKIVIKRKRGKNTVSFSFVLLFVLLWILIAFNTASADIDYYLNMFVRIKNGITYHAVESGFYILCKIAVSMGMDYPIFLVLYSSVAMLLVGSTVYRYSKNPCSVLFYYFCYPFILDIAQLRHFMAVAIFIFAIRYLEEYNKKNIIKYCLLILLATSQQILAFAFFMFLIVYFSDNKKIVKISVALMLVMLVGQRLLINTWIYRNILGLRDAEIDYSHGISIGMFLQYVLFYMVLLGFCLYLNRIKKTDSNLLFKISMLSAVYIPLLLIDFQFTRFFRSCVMVIYIYISNGIAQLRYSRDRLFYGVIFGGGMVAVFVILFGPTSGYFETITQPVFEQNGLIKFFVGN